MAVVCTLRCGITIIVIYTSFTSPSALQDWLFTVQREFTAEWFFFVIRNVRLKVVESMFIRLFMFKIYQVYFVIWSYELPVLVELPWIRFAE